MQCRQILPGSKAHRLSNTRTLYSTPMAAWQPVRAQPISKSLFQHRPALLLERAVGDNFGADSELWQQVSFDAGIAPDLPVVSNWRQMGARLLGRQVAAPQVTYITQNAESAELHSQAHRQHVQTLAAQTYNVKQMQQRILSACSHESSTVCSPADALLLLSGSHPFRQLPWANRWTTSSLQTLKLAHRLRLAGSIPVGTGLWAVENPLTNSIDRLKSKIDAGAEVVITQPPLLWDKFEAWMNQVQQQQILGDTKLVVGCPMISSAGNMKFWLYLCQASSSPGSDAAVAPFLQAAAQGKEVLAAYCQQYNSELVHKVLDFPEVAGLHFMPLTRQARALTVPVVQSVQT